MSEEKKAGSELSGGLSARTYGGATLEEIKQSPRSYGEVSVIEDLCDRIIELEAGRTVMPPRPWVESRPPSDMVIPMLQQKAQ